MIAFKINLYLLKQILVEASKTIETFTELCQIVKLLQVKD